jgi:WD40 repeat protein
MDCFRKYNAFDVDGSETWLVSGDLGGEFQLIDLARFEVVDRLQAHYGEIEAISVHPSLPYAASTCGDRACCIVRIDAAARRLRLMHQVPLREIRAENGYAYGSHVPPGSQAIAFHPSERRLLTRADNGALAEIEFDDEGWRPTWCHGYFERPDGSAADTVYARYLVGTEWVMCSGRAGLAVIDPQRRDEPLLRWQYDPQNLHHAAHVEGTEYLLASDSRRIIRFDMSGRKPPLVGPYVTRDHCEHVEYNPVTRRAFCSAFDRCVREFDPDTLEHKGIVVETPFKLRWFKSLRNDPDVMIICCRNGALLKVDIRRREVLAVLKETPNTLWSAASVGPRQVFVAGEGADVLRIEASAETRDGDTRFDCRWLRLQGDPGRFTKRIAYHPVTRRLLLARSDGDVIEATPQGDSRLLVNLGAAVRDLVPAPDEPHFFAACEDGSLHRVDARDGGILGTFHARDDEPLWCLDYQPARRLLVAGERVGGHYLIDAVNLTTVGMLSAERWDEVLGREQPAKRARFFDHERLLLAKSSSLWLYDLGRDELRRVVAPQGNTFEDFDWTPDRRYLAFVTYVWNVGLVDCLTWTQLDSMPIDLDYVKGVVWLSPDRATDAYPYEILAFGRAGIVNRYRVHDSRLVQLEHLAHELSEPVHDARGVQFAPHGRAARPSNELARFLPA